MAAYTRCLRCAGAPRRPASGSGLSLSILSWHTVLSDPGEFDHRQFQRSDVDAAFAESRPARHSQDSRNPFHAGDDFRGFMVHTSATVCQLARPLHGSDRSPSQRGFYIRAFSGLVALPAAGYNYNSDWTPLLAGLSPARMAASLAAPTPINPGRGIWLSVSDRRQAKLLAPNRTTPSRSGIACFERQQANGR